MLTVPLSKCWEIVNKTAYQLYIVYCAPFRCEIRLCICKATYNLALERT